MSVFWSVVRSKVSALASLLAVAAIVMLTVSDAAPATSLGAAARTDPLAIAARVNPLALGTLGVDMPDHPLATGTPGVSILAQNGFGDRNNSWSWSMAWFHGKLYVGTGRDEL